MFIYVCVCGVPTYVGVCIRVYVYFNNSKTASQLNIPDEIHELRNKIKRIYLRTGVVHNFPKAVGV